MTKTIAMGGKGGVGKTTVAALLIKLLSAKGLVLALDADPSTNLNQALGIPLDDSQTIGTIREKMSEDVSRGQLSPTMPKQEYLYGKILGSLAESKGFDLLAMGRPEGPGCYCASNRFLRDSLDQLVQDYKYDYIVMDCEAGLEHISRQTTRDIDVLLIMSDPTIRGITAAGRMKKLIEELRSNVGRAGLIVNRVKGELTPEIKKAIEETGLEVFALIPEEADMPELEMRGKPVTDLPRESQLQSKVKEVAERLSL
jgi:CO dehydrogenase maturation factor